MFTQSFTSSNGGSFAGKTSLLSYEKFENNIKKEFKGILITHDSKKSSFAPPEVEYPGADDIFMDEDEDTTEDTYQPICIETYNEDEADTDSLKAEELTEEDFFDMEKKSASKVNTPGISTENSSKMNSPRAEPEEG